MIRGFLAVSEKFRKHNFEPTLPQRGSKTSAGYDFVTPVDIEIKPGKTSDLIMTDIKAYMRPNEVLTLYIRSSIGIKKGLVLANTTGIIDADYFENPDNDGNIGFKLRNLSDQTVKIQKGERIMQGIFLPFLEADNGNTTSERISGFGSTGK